jgi:hypothetical protein
MPITPRKGAGARRLTCRICREVADVDLVTLDIVLGDPRRWPRTLWEEGGLEPPKGLLPVTYRQWGQKAVGKDWLIRRGYRDVAQDNYLATHCRHVAVVAADPRELVTAGVVAGTPIRHKAVEPIDPNAYLAYYAKGIKLGIRGFDMLERRVTDIEARGDEVPFDIVKMLVETGARLATSQAQIRARGLRMHEDEDTDAFRRAASPENDGEVPHFGELRIRTIDGETRPVVDSGRGDRQEYNEKAAREGLPGITT